MGAAVVTHVAPQVRIMRLWHSELRLHHLGYRPTFYTPRWAAHSHGMVKVFVKCQQMILDGQYSCSFAPSTKAFIFSFQVTGDTNTGPKVCLLRLSALTRGGGIRNQLLSALRACVATSEPQPSVASGRFAGEISQIEPAVNVSLDAPLPFHYRLADEKSINLVVVT